MKVILVIDDEPQMRRMLRMMLEREGFAVLEAENGEVGLRLIQESHIDLVITDLIMPEKEGLETIMEMRSAFPRLNIIAISGGGRAEPDGYLKMAESLGAARVFSKPLDRSELLDAVHDIIGRAATA